MKTVVRVNGRGNAWPVLLGSTHPFYSMSDSNDLSSASYSLIYYEGEILMNEAIRWEILIDAGHHTVPFLIKNENRIPEAIVLTHGHADHSLGIDWVAQSYFFKYNKKYPLYATTDVWEVVRNTFPQLNSIILFRELLMGVRTRIEETPDLFVTAFPVFHGPHTKGPAMLFFDDDNNQITPILFTGDMLCPLLRKNDYAKISKASMAFIDTNNRYPFPASNHESFASKSPVSGNAEGILAAWFNNNNMLSLTAPHTKSNKNDLQFFEEFLSDWGDIREVPLCILDFAVQTRIPLFYLIHYSGYHDIIHYNQQQLDSSALERWANNSAENEGVVNVNFRVPVVGAIMDLSINSKTI